MSVGTCLACLLLLVGAQDPGPGEWVRDLGSAAAERREAARAGLQAGAAGELHQQVMQALWAGFEDAPVRARRERAALLADSATAADLEAAGVHCADSDQQVRRLLIGLMARPDLGASELALRVAALEERARADCEADLRATAVEALAGLDREPAIEALARLLQSQPGAERAHIAASLPRTQRSASLVRELVRRGFEPRSVRQRTPDEVLAAVLPIYAHQLAELDSTRWLVPGAEPLIMGLEHPSPAVRGGAAEAFSQLLQRQRTLGHGHAARASLAALGEAGLDPRVVHFHRARLAFFPAGDAEAALVSARALAGSREPARAGARLAARSAGADGEARLWLFRAFYLEGMAHLAAGRPQVGRERLEWALHVLEASLARREDLSDESSREQHVEQLHQAALTRVGLAVAQLAQGVAGDDPALLAGLRRAHLESLQAQALHARVTGEAFMGWDALLDSELSPYRLLFTGLVLPGIDRPRALQLQTLLGRALASVSAREQPGFAPFEGLPQSLTDCTADPMRLGLLKEIQLARLRGLDESIGEVQLRIQERGGTGWELPEEDAALLEGLQLQRRVLSVELDGRGAAAEGALAELRVPGSQALWLARDLREEGRSRDSRELAVRMREDLERFGISNWWYYLGVERMVRADLVIGSCYTDEDEPLRAEEALLGAVERVEGVIQRLDGNGVAEGELQPFRNLQASALVSLAVNANVRLGRPQRALEYYERAYQYRQDEFMRILLACYRARSGRAGEARDLLREIQPGPQTWYNMACTYALLGETERALEFLAKELQENHASEASRRRQQKWAAGDPDLASLREDPLFLELVGR